MVRASQFPIPPLRRDKQKEAHDIVCTSQCPNTLQLNYFSVSGSSRLVIRSSEAVWLLSLDPLVFSAKCHLAVLWQNISIALCSHHNSALHKWRGSVRVCAWACSKWLDQTWRSCPFVWRPPQQTLLKAQVAPLLPVADGPKQLWA